MQVYVQQHFLGKNVILPYNNKINSGETLTFNSLEELKSISGNYYYISSFLQPSIYDINLFSPGIASQIISFGNEDLWTGQKRAWLWGGTGSSPKFSVSGLVDITNGAVLSSYYNTYLTGGTQELIYTYNNKNTTLKNLVYDVPNDHFPWTSYPDQRLHIDFDNTSPKLVFGLQPSKFGFYTRMFENAWPVFNALKTNDVGFIINDIAGLQQKKLSSKN